MTADERYVAASSTRTATHWRRIDIFIVVSLLSLLLLVQFLLAMGGVLPAGPLGLGAEVYRFFPTVLTGYAVLLIGWRRGLTLAGLGFNRNRIVWPAFLAWLAAVSSGPLYVGVRSLGLIGIGNEERELLPLLLMLSFGVVVVAPVVEELTFRALLFRGIRQRWPFLPAAFLSSFVFASLHLEPRNIVPLTLTGMAFAWAYDRTGSIWSSILPHAGLNALVLVALFASG